MNLPEGFSVRCGTATSAVAFAVAISERTVDEPFSYIVQYNSTYRQPWGRADIPEEIYDIERSPVQRRAKFPFVALSDEGNVYFLGLTTEMLSISGAGLRKSGSRRLGFTFGLTSDGNLLYAYGERSQIYLSQGDDRWLPITGPSVSGLSERGMITVTDLVEDRGSLVVAAEVSDRDAPDKANALFEDDFEAFLDAALQEVKPTWGALWRKSGDQWTQISLPYSGLVTAMSASDRYGLLVGLSSGLVLALTERDELTEVCAPDTPQAVVAICEFDGRVMVATTHIIATIDDDILVPLAGANQPDFAKKTVVDAVAIDGVVWVFTAAAIHLLQDGVWTEIEVPDAVLRVPFEGL